MSHAAEMVAVRVHEPGGPEALRTDRIPVREPGPGELLVRLEAAGLNFIDIYKRTGQYPLPDLPATLGEEGAGTVAAVGEGVKGIVEGQRVAWAGASGSYAEYTLVPADKAVPLSAGMSSREGAAVMLQGLTAHYLATSTFNLRDGIRCLIHAAAGGVGLLLVQIAKRRGAYVIGTAGTEEKADLARSAGADEAIVYTRDDFAEEVPGITKGEGVHVIYDSVGRSTFLKGLDLLAPRGMMVLYGQSSGPVEPIDPQVLNRKGSLYLTRPSLGHYVATRDELLRRARDLFSWIDAGELTVRVGRVFPLTRAADAHRALEGRETTGKVLLVPEEGE
jgi:NADPH:quinone reductase